MDKRIIFQRKAFLTLVYTGLGLNVSGGILSIIGLLVGFGKANVLIVMLIHLIISSALVCYSIILLKHNRDRLAQHLYVGAELSLTTTLLTVAEPRFAPIVLLSFGVYVLVAAFVLPERQAYAWGAFGAVGAVVALTLRHTFGATVQMGELGWITDLATYGMTPTLVLLYVVLGIQPTQTALEALSKTERVVESLEETVRERTEGIQQAYEQAEQMRYFIQGLGHDLKTPAASIEMCVEELMHVLPPDEANAWREVHRIDETREVLSRRIWTMLDIAAGMENGLTINPISFHDLEEEATLNMGPIKRAYNAEHVHITFEYEPGTVLADGAALGRAIENLVVNSIKAQREQEQGYVRVQIRQSDNVVTITVDDAGPGFPQMRLKSVETVTTLQRRPKGSHGLGLVGVRTIVEMLGGTLLLANRAEGGARVTIMLPQPERQPMLEAHTHATDIGH